MSLPALPSIPDFITCSAWLHRNVGITLMYKDKTGYITGATVKFKSGYWSASQVANTNGILYYLCVPLNYSVEVTAQKAGVDFGNGIGKEAKVGNATIGTMGLGNYLFPSYISKTYFPCPSVTPIIALSNFESSLPTAIPNVTVLPIIGYITDLGSFSITEGTYNIQLDNTSIQENSVPSSGKIDTNLPAIKNIQSLKNKTSTTVKVTIYWYHCIFIATKTVYLPTVPTVPIAPTPKLPTSCTDLNTTVESVSVPNILPSDITIPFYISLNNIRLQCPSKGSSDKITNGVGSIKLGDLPSIDFSIPSSGQSAGSVYLDIFKAYKDKGVDITQILKAAQISAPATPQPTTPKPSEIEFETRARLEGRLGTTAGYIVPLSTVQAYVTAIKPGTTVEQQSSDSSWYGAYKIIRTNGTYFWATEYSTINSYL